MVFLVRKSGFSVQSPRGGKIIFLSFPLISEHSRLVGVLRSSFDWFRLPFDKLRMNGGTWLSRPWRGPHTCMGGVLLKDER